MTRQGLGTVTKEMASAPERRSSGGRADDFNIRSDRGMRDYRIHEHDVVRIHPRERDFMAYNRAGHFWGPDPHYFGWRVEVLPPRYRRVRYYGIDYYFWNDVYYRPFRGHYVICRPPIGVILDRALHDITFASVRFAYYSSMYRTYSAIDANNRYIDEQNRIIAQNNATIAAQNNAIALNSSAAGASYSIANQLGLVQSYAYADKEYFYEDGVFYIVNANGRYEVIVPPAGALVEKLPEDYDTLTLGGVEYYRVDDTVYRMVLVSGVPYLEVLGQMYGDMARKYNSYYQ